MASALVVTTDGKAIEKPIDNDTAYEVIRDGVGGMIEMVVFNDQVTMWVNEEGKLIGLPHNKPAQAAFNEVFGSGRDFIVGDVVFTGGADEEGNTLGLTPEAVESVLDLVALATV